MGDHTGNKKIITVTNETYINAESVCKLTCTWGLQKRHYATILSGKKGFYYNLKSHVCALKCSLYIFLTVKYMLITEQ